MVSSSNTSFLKYKSLNLNVMLCQKHSTCNMLEMSHRDRMDDNNGEGEGEGEGEGKVG